MKTTILLLALTLPCHAAISFSLPGNSGHAVWTGLNSSNHTSAEGFPSYPIATNPWPNAISPDAGATLDGEFDKVSGGGYFATSSLYDSGIPGTFRLSRLTAITDLETVIFQADVGSVLGGAPLLSYNGGTQDLAADYSANFTGDYVSGFGGPLAPTTNQVWQWDLSGTGEAITEYAITWSTAPHGTVYQLNLSEGDSFAQVVPEPSAALLGVLSLSLLTFHRRRA